METLYTRRGFLPDPDPLTRFPEGSALAVLDRIGDELPERLTEKGFRDYARKLDIPAAAAGLSVRELRLYYVRLAFLASGYVNQVGEEPASVLPPNIAVPFVDVCRRLNRPPILSYDGYALYNWQRIDPAGPIALGNIDTFQNFVTLYDEHWFILVHVEIEAIAAGIFMAIARAAEAMKAGDAGRVDECLRSIEDCVRRQADVLRRIPERMDPSLYYRTFRPYIRFFENVVYEGVDEKPVSLRGETGAQSSIMPALIAFLKIPHQPSPLVNHLADMRNYMPAEHRAMLTELAALPSVRDVASCEAFNGVLDAVADFREVHHGWAHKYINAHVADPRGTGGTPYMGWLSQLIDETRGWRIPETINT
jgi:indoleamine 2,3-dioxygenase